MSEPKPLQQVDRTFVLFDGRKMSYFAGCDYYRMSSHPAVLRAVEEGLRKYGLNVAASRITTGNHALYRKLEETLARFFQAPDALVVANGYATNLIVAQALRGEFTHVLVDAKAHVSLQDASGLFGAPVLQFKNRDLVDLQRVLAGLKPTAKPILLTDGVFTYEGEVAPLKQYLKLLGPRGMILVDDAHAAGIVGDTGRGSVEASGIGRERVIQTGTMSKAFGAYGGFVLCSRKLREKMFETSMMFAGSTPLPLPLVYAGIRSVEILGKEKGHLERLRSNTNYLKSKLREMGHPTALTEVPVAAVTPPNGKHAARMRRRLMAAKVFPSFIIYPGGPPGGYLRMVVSSEHTKRQFDALLAGVE